MTDKIKEFREKFSWLYTIHFEQYVGDESMGTTSRGEELESWLQKALKEEREEVLKEVLKKGQAVTPEQFYIWITNELATLSKEGRNK